MTKRRLYYLAAIFGCAAMIPVIGFLAFMICVCILGLLGLLPGQ